MSPSSKSRKRTPFSISSPPKTAPLGSRFPPDKYEIVQALRSYQIVLYEADTLLNATLHEREIKLAIVNAYKDKKGKSFQKAQKAALECDELTERAKSLRDEKLALEGDVAKIWTKYSGSAIDGVIVSLWVCKGMTPMEIAIATHKTYEKVVSALYAFRNLLVELLRIQTEIPHGYKKKVVEDWAKKWCVTGAPTNRKDTNDD